MRKFLSGIGPFVLGCLALGGFLILLAIDDAREVRRQANWSAAIATILASREVADSVGAYVEVICEYNVNGSSYRLTDSVYEFDDDGAIPQRLQPTQMIEVFYDPTDPITAVLIRAHHGPVIFHCIIAAIPFLIASPFVVYWFAMLYARFHLNVARRHLELARREIAEGAALMKEVDADGDAVDPVLADVHEHTVKQFGHAESMIRNLEGQVNDSAFDSQQTVEKETHTAEPESAPASEPVVLANVYPVSRHAFNMPLQLLLTGMIPVAIGICVSLFFPYYLVECRSDGKGRVDCEIQRLALGVIPLDRRQRINAVTSVTAVQKGNRSRSGYLDFSGEDSLEIPAGRNVFSAGLVERYLATPTTEPLQFSDGYILSGLIIPWAAAFFGVLGVVFLVWEGMGNVIHHKDGSRTMVVFNNTTSHLISFLMGSYVTSCISGLGFAYFVDVYRATAMQWLVLSTVCCVGGFINVARTIRRRRRGESGSVPDVYSEATTVSRA